MDGGAWWAAVHGVAKSRTWLSDFTFTFHFHALEKEMATHSSVLAWRIPGTGEPGGLPSMGSHRVGHDWSDLASSSSSKCLKICSDSHPKPKPNLWSFVQSNQDVFKYYFIVSYRILQFLCVYVCWLTSCYILCDPVDCSPPSFSFHGILQQRILEWVALPSSRGSSRPRDRTHISWVSCIGRCILYH